MKMLTKLNKEGLRVDVVIPVYKPDDKFKQLLQMLACQTVKVNKAICMYTKTDDEDVFPEYDDEKINALPIEVHYLNKDEFDHGKTRNEGFSHSDADIAISMTCDCIPDDVCLVENLIAGLMNDNAASCYARQLPSDKSSLQEKYSRAFNYPDEDRIKSKADIETMGIKAFFCSNVCAAYRKDVFDSLGGFPLSTIFNEDMIYARKVLDNGYNIVYKADARVIHSHDYTNMQQLRRNFDLAVSQKMHPEVFGGISSESEGIKFVLAAGKYFVKNGNPFYIVPFVITTAYKYIGFKLGKKYDSLSDKTIRRLTMNRPFFDKMYTEKKEK